MKKKLILKGVPASSGIVEGKVRLISNFTSGVKMEHGEILVTSITNPLLTSAIMKAGALITDFGGVLSHPAMIAREMGIPAVVATKTATKMLKNGMRIVIDGGEGVIYEKT